MNKDKSLNKEIGERIRDLRLSNSLTIDQLSVMLDISPGFLGLIERGSRGMAIGRWIEVCDIFRVSLDYLLTGRGEPVTYSERDKQINNAAGILKKNELQMFIEMAKNVALYNYTDDEMVLLHNAIEFQMNTMNKIKRLRTENA